MPENDNRDRRAIRLLALIEAATVTGHAGNLIEFCRRARTSIAGLPPVECSIVGFHRGDVPPDGMPPNLFVEAVREAGVAIDVIEERFRFDPRVPGQLRRILLDRAPDLVITYNIKSHFLMKLTGLRRRFAWIAYHHGYTTTDLKMRAYNQINRWSLPSADRVITVCEAFAGELAGQGVPRKRIAVLHSSLQPLTRGTAGEVSVLRNRYALDSGCRVVLAVGRLSREKGHLDLVHAFHHLGLLCPEWPMKLVVVGEGPERPRIESLARSLGLADQVILAGLQDRMWPYYELADMLVLPSHSEGSPLALLEAMAAGVPVVATAVGGVPEMVTHEQEALLAPPRDPQALAQAMLRVLSDSRLAVKLAARAAARVVSRHSPEAYCRSLLEICGETLAARAATS